MSASLHFELEAPCLLSCVLGPAVTLLEGGIWVAFFTVKKILDLNDAYPPFCYCYNLPYLSYRN